MEQKKKTIIIASVIAVGVAILAGLVFGIISMVSQGRQLPLPSGLAVVELSDGTKKIIVDPSRDATSYLFTVQKESALDATKTTSVDYQFNATALLSAPANYTISCQYLGNFASNASQSIKITYKSTITLDAPTLTLGTGADTGKLFISTASHYPDALNFECRITYVEGQEVKSSTAFTTTENNKHGLLQGYFNLPEIITKAGTYSIIVQLSATDNTFYLPATAQTLVCTVA